MALTLARSLLTPQCSRLSTAIALEELFEIKNQDPSLDKNRTTV